MIIGTGSDIMDIRRIEKTLARFGERFEKRIFTQAERDKAGSRAKAGIKTVASTYAKRFAAKEACAKALGTGLNNGVTWHDMEVINQPGGAPTIVLHGGAAARLKSLAPRRSHITIHVSLTDEYPYALAHVIISADLIP
jgi:holo-[acyl-carrier protein] synthase